VKNLFISFVYIVTAFVFYSFGDLVSYDDQMKIFEALRNTSAVVFGVMGAWIAILCPGLLTDLFSNKSTLPNGVSAEKFNKLLSPLVYATFILIFATMATVVAPAVKNIPFFSENYTIVRRFCFAFIGVISIALSWSLLLTLLPTDMASRAFTRHSSLKKVEDEYFKCNSKQ